MNAKRLASLFLLLTCGAAIASSGAGSETTRPQLPQMAVYRWAAKPQNVDAFAKWINRPDVWGEDFTAVETWDNIENPGWLLRPWAAWVKQRPGRRWMM